MFVYKFGPLSLHLPLFENLQRVRSARVWTHQNHIHYCNAVLHDIQTSFCLLLVEFYNLPFIYIYKLPFIFEVILWMRDKSEFLCHGTYWRSFIKSKKEGRGGGITLSHAWGAYKASFFYRHICYESTLAMMQVQGTTQFNSTHFSHIIDSWSVLCFVVYFD